MQGNPTRGAVQVTSLTEVVVGSIGSSLCGSATSCGSIGSWRCAGLQLAVDREGHRAVRACNRLWIDRVMALCGSTTGCGWRGSSCCAGLQQAVDEEDHSAVRVCNRLWMERIIAMSKQAVDQEDHSAVRVCNRLWIERVIAMCRATPLGELS